LLGLACIGLILGSTHRLATAADSPQKYDGVPAALQQGEVVSVLSDLSRCTAAHDGTAGPAVQGGIKINGFIVTQRSGLAFSDVHQTLDMAGRPVTEFIRYTVDAEGKVTIRTARLAAGASETVSEGDYVCPSPGGVTFVW
jgi:VirK protein